MMKIVKISMELVIDDDENFYIPEEISGGVFTPRFDNDKIAQYLNNKLYTDPEFFGDFGPENIVSVGEFV
jgi:hypothetical protein